MTTPAVQLLEAAGVGVVSGVVSARIAVAVLTTDVGWIKQQIAALWRRLEKIEDKLT